MSANYSATQTASTMSQTSSKITIKRGADFHCHLRQDNLMKAVVPCVQKGGCSIAYVMPNLVPPIETAAAAEEYWNTLNKIDPRNKYYMTLYLTPTLTVEELELAKANKHVMGVKFYPKGATTNSEHGASNVAEFETILAKMEKLDLVLNIHGEIPDCDVMKAEEQFLPTLSELNKRFPKLRIVLEHCSTRAAIEAVKQCSDTVCGSITAHHLYLTKDDWAVDPLCFCKPVAKTEDDRQALIEAATSKSPKFFMGSDSAPHPQAAKLKSAPAAGVFTQPILMPLLAEVFDNAGKLDCLEHFTSLAGCQFYKVAPPQEEITLEKNSEQPKNVDNMIRENGVEVPIFPHPLKWSIH